MLSRPPAGDRRVHRRSRCRMQVSEDVPLEFAPRVLELHRDVSFRNFRLDDVVFYYKRLRFGY